MSSEEGGYAAYIEEMEGVNGQGEPLVEARESLLEGLNLTVGAWTELSNEHEPVKEIREMIVTLNG